tara:strand:- start:202 stop:573 length:372 start_codon:yes stop_codon:yes gene_type:complete
MIRFVLLLLLISTSSYAHQMMPTYPKLGFSHIEGVKKVQMKIFNSREDVEFYEIGVFDINFKAIPFVSLYKIIKIDYLSTVKFDVYITEADSLAAEYLCSMSKLRTDTNNQAMLATKICSRFK